MAYRTESATRTLDLRPVFWARQVVTACLWLLLSLLACPAAGSSAPLEHVTLQLKWLHQFQFAGYYAAVEQGYYRDAGLDVELRERKPGQKRGYEAVLAGEAQYAVESTNVLVRRLKGDPLVVLAAIFQHSPVVAVALQEKGIQTADDLVGKRLMSYGEKSVEVELMAMLLKEGIDPLSIDWLPISYDINSLVRNETDLYSAYLTNEPFFLEQQGIPVQIINPLNYGIDFYGDILFTSEEELSAHPQRAAAFRRASLKGWQYALEHPDEMVDLILEKYSQRKNREHLLFEARETLKLIRPDVVRIGHVNPGRFQHMADSLKLLGHVDDITRLSGFFYASEEQALLSDAERRWLQQGHRVRVFIAHAPPMVYVQNGRIEGLLIDYLEHLAKHYGIPLDYVQMPWADAVTGVGGVDGPDLIPLIIPAEEHTRTMAFSEPFVSMPIVIFTRDSEDYVGGIEDLAGARVAVHEGFLAAKTLKTNYPDIILVETATMQEAVELLATGRVDAYIGNLMLTTHLLKERGLENIKVAAPFPDIPAEHVLAVRRDWPELASLFNRSLAQITPAEHVSMRQRWLSTTLERGVSVGDVWRWGGLILLAVLVGFVLFSLWTRRLKREIRQRKITESALEHSFKQYRYLVQSIPHGLLELDDNWRIVYTNASFARLLVYTEAQLRDKTLADLGVDGATLQRMREHVERGTGHLSLKVPLKDAMAEWHETQFDIGEIVPESKGNPVIIVTDLTKLEETARALERSETFYRATFENIQAGIVHLSADGRVVRANSYICDLLGYTHEEFNALTLADFTYQEDLALSKNMLEQLRAAGKDSYSLIKRYQKKNGEHTWGLVTVALQEDIDGSPGYIGVIQDINDIKKQQDEVRQNAENLENIINSRTAELKKRVEEVEKLNFAMMNLADDLQQSNIDLALQREKLAEANAELEAFAYTVSHDLRAPLRHISGFVDILKGQAEGQLDEAGFRTIERITAAARRMGELIDDLLVFSRAGRSDLMLAPIDMNLLFSEAWQDLMTDFKGAPVDWRISPLPRVHGDVTTLRQVVFNLLDNALKFSSKVEKPRIEVSTEKDEKFVIFNIQDNGVGFDPDYSDKLFKVFQRLHRLEEFDGTGIGLASVRRIVVRHGGWVRAQSKKGEGARFSFALPIASEEIDVAEQESHTAGR